MHVFGNYNTVNHCKMCTISYFNVLIFLHIRDMNLVMLDTAKPNFPNSIQSDLCVLAILQCILITLYSHSVQFSLLQERKYCSVIFI